MAMKSGNPALSDRTFAGLGASNDPIMLLALLLIGAGWVWNLYFAAREGFALGGILLLYIVDLILGLFGHPVEMIHQGGPWGIVFSLFVVCIAALNLVMNFDLIARGVAQRKRK